MIDRCGTCGAEMCCGSPRFMTASDSSTDSRLRYLEQLDYALRQIADAREGESTEAAMRRVTDERTKEWSEIVFERDAEIERLHAVIQDMRKTAFSARAAANDAIWSIEEIGKREAEDVAAARRAEVGSALPLCPLSVCRHSLPGQHAKGSWVYACIVAGCSCVISTTTLAEVFPWIAKELSITVARDPDCPYCVRHHPDERCTCVPSVNAPRIGGES